MAILGLLMAEAQSGYDLEQSFRASLGFAWTAFHSQIYPELARMVTAGLIVGRDAGSRRRRTYEPTSEGRRVFRAWLVEEPDRTERNEAALRLFLIWTLSPSEQRSYLEREAQHHELALIQLEGYAGHIRTTGTPNIYGLMLEWGLRFHRARLDWIAWSIGEIEAGRGPSPKMIGAPAVAGGEAKNADMGVIGRSVFPQRGITPGWGISIPM